MSLRTDDARRGFSYRSHVAIRGVKVPVAVNPRCCACDKLLAHYLTMPYALECPRCKALNQSGEGATPIEISSAA